MKHSYDYLPTQDNSHIDEIEM